MKNREAGSKRRWWESGGEGERVKREREHAPGVNWNTLARAGGLPGGRELHAQPLCSTGNHLNTSEFPSQLSLKV